MKALVITPRDPLLFRDGRPFSSDPGSRAKSQSFPMPSTVIGAIRTRAGLNSNGVWQPEKHSLVLEYTMRGPMLLKTPSTPKLEHLLISAPLDALMLNNQKIRVLQPLALGQNEQINLEYAPVGLAQIDPKDKSKPEGMPKYWYWQAFIAWLEQANDFPTTPEQLGIAALSQDTRVHVGMNPTTQTADDGALFATSALEFVQTPINKKLSQAVHYGLYTEISHSHQAAAFAALGGENRYAGFEQIDNALLPKMLEYPNSKRIHDAVLAQQKIACRVVLLTPAYFKHGWRPEYLLEPRFGVTPKLIAASIGKPQTISGWDYALTSPKPTRRLVPAGSVYYLELHGNKENISQWLCNYWLQNISDEAQKTAFSSAFPARKDGFGLCAIGIWDGKLQPLEVKL